MVTALELGVLAVAVVVLLAGSRALGTARALIVNAVVGLLTLWVATWFGLEVAVTPLVLLIVALGGFPGALLVVLLAVFEFAFVAGAAPMVALVG